MVDILGMGGCGGFLSMAYSVEMNVIFVVGPVLEGTPVKGAPTEYSIRAVSLHAQIFSTNYPIWLLRLYPSYFIYLNVQPYYCIFLLYHLIQSKFDDGFSPDFLETRYEIAHVAYIHNNFNGEPVGIIEMCDGW